MIYTSTKFVVWVPAELDCRYQRVSFWRSWSIYSYLNRWSNIIWATCIGRDVPMRVLQFACKVFCLGARQLGWISLDIKRQDLIDHHKISIDIIIDSHPKKDECWLLAAEIACLMFGLIILPVYCKLVLQIPGFTSCSVEDVEAWTGFQILTSIYYVKSKKEKIFKQFEICPPETSWVCPCSSMFIYFFSASFVHWSLSRPQVHPWDLQPIGHSHPKVSAGR